MGSFLRECTYQGTKGGTDTNRPDAKRRYYHMFAKDELRRLIQLAQEIRLVVDSPSLPVNGAEKARAGNRVEIVATGWERSNYYIELWRWKR